MAARSKAGAVESSTTYGGVNEVRLVGRVSVEPERREMPSGDTLWSVRLVVPRDDGARTRQSVDTLDCAVWSARLHRSVATWAPGDVVEVNGALRRRFYRAGGAAASRTEVEVSHAKVIHRAASG